jgi:hypothetical protein
MWRASVARSGGVCGRSTQSLAVMRNVAEGIWLWMTIALLLAMNSANATSCAVRDPALVARDASIAFIAKVKTIEASDYERPSRMCATTVPNSGCGSRLATLNVSRVLRGRVDPVVTVISEDVCICHGPAFNLGWEYLVVAEPNRTGLPGDYIAKSECEGTRRLTSPEHDYSRLKAWGDK